MTSTGYKLSNGLDLSSVFQPGSSSTLSGLLMSNGQDIYTIFAPGTSSISTGYLTVSGVDIATLFQRKIVFNVALSLASTTFWGVCSANNGVAYISASGSFVNQKTTDYGTTWTSTTTGGGDRGIATNATNTMLVQGYAAGVLRYSTDQGNNWNNSGSASGTQGCFLSRNNNNNTVIFNRNGVKGIYFSDSPYSTVTQVTTPITITNVASACCISDVPNYIYANGSVVYRNTTSGTLASFTDMTNNVSTGAESKNFFSACCNSNGTVNLILNRGGSIYRSTTWDGTFTKIANSPVGTTFRSISTSSIGNIVCAVTETSVYISTDMGLTFYLATTPSLLTNEYMYYSTVSPDEKFILITTQGSTTARAFLCVL